MQGPGGFDPPKLVPMSAMLAIGSLTLAGVVAGLYPARKAAMLQPVEALAGQRSNVRFAIRSIDHVP